MARAIRPGGRIILQDDDHSLLRLWPEPEGLRSLWQAYVRTYEAAGNDPYVGRRLVSLMTEQAIRPVRNSWIFFGACAGHPDFPTYVRNLVEVFEGAREEVLGQLEISTGGAGLSAAVLFDSAIGALDQWAEQSNAALWYATCWAEGLKPE
jgi:hypothetical protein